MRQVTLGVVQMACGADRDANLAEAEGSVRAAAAQGANIVVLQELFETPYFCPDKKPAHFDLARRFDGNSMVERMSRLASELGVVLPVSFFEQSGADYFNALATIDADGSVLGLYRKSHIPEGPGYEEKHYFKSGDTGFVVCDTRFGRLGAAICWDQWFPECARALTLRGAEILVYPSAIGNEPQDPDLDSRHHWRRVMQGHAAANMVPLAAANRVGTEQHDSATMTFYGSSFIADGYGAVVAEAPDDAPAIITASFDLDQLAEQRRSWGLFRDRRPDLYDILTQPGRRPDLED